MQEKHLSGVKVKMNINKGRYWDFGWQIIDGCTPCSPGCDNCWSAAMTCRFKPWPYEIARENSDCHYPLTTEQGHFTGQIVTYPERLFVPLKRKKPAVYAIWNDFWHESVPDDFQYYAYEQMVEWHTFLILTKRPHIAAAFYAQGKYDGLLPRDNIWHGLTVCTQQEADEKIPIFLKVPGKKFLSHEPALERIDYGQWLKEISCLISGGETGSGGRPSHPDIFRADRDQCEQTGTAFFLKNLGKGKGRELDGREYNEIPWVKK